MGTKIPKKLGTIIKFLWEKLGTIIIPIGIELLPPTVWEFLSPTFGDKNSQIPKSWAAHLEVKCVKNLGVRSTFGTLLKVEMSKKCTQLWREAHLEVKLLKAFEFGPLLEVQISKKCTLLWREAHLEVKRVKNWRSWSTLGS